MAKRLTFAEFKRAIDSRTLPMDLLREYVMFGSDTGIPILVFTPDALLDAPPAGYDLDGDVYKMVVEVSHHRRSVFRALSITSPTRIALIGDSWFKMPGDGGDGWPKEAGDWLLEDPSLDCWMDSRWGDTLSYIVGAKRYLDSIREHSPDYILISGGGNDMQKGVAAGKYVRAYDPKLPATGYLTTEGEQAILDIGTRYSTLIKEVADRRSSVRVICHGYDYPRPTVDSKYIGRHLAKLRIPESLMPQITASIIDKLNDQIALAVKGTNAIYVNCRNATSGLTWNDDMHPKADGFKIVAALLRGAIT